LRERAMDSEHGDSRRDFMKKGAYVVPAVLTLNLALVEARAASGEITPNTRDSERPTDIRDQRDVTR
jgi:hypothetical protein